MKFWTLKLTEIQIPQKVNLDPETSSDISQIVKNIFKVMVTVSCQYKVMLICLVHYSLFLSIPVQEPQNSNLSLRYHCIVKLTTGDNGKQNKQGTPHSICAKIFRQGSKLKKLLSRHLATKW